MQIQNLLNCFSFTPSCS